MGKPDWSEAPDRANYTAMDLDGTWYWFELEPYPYAGKLWATYGASWLAKSSDGVLDPSWQKTLEGRP